MWLENNNALVFIPQLEYVFDYYDHDRQLEKGNSDYCSSLVAALEGTLILFGLIQDPFPMQHREISGLAQLGYPQNSTSIPPKMDLVDNKSPLKLGYAVRPVRAPLEAV